VLEKLDKELSLFTHRLTKVGLGELLLELDETVADGWAYGDVEHDEATV